MSRTRTKPFRPAISCLETRLLLDASSKLPPPVTAGPGETSAIPNASILAYYGIDKISFAGPGGSRIQGTGQGQTIVIIGTDRDGSYRDSTSAEWKKSGLAQYSKWMGLPYNETGTNSDFSFTMINQRGDTSFDALPPAADSIDDSGEFVLDTQAVHLIAPNANIIVVVADSSDNADFNQAITTALTYHPTAISISYAGSETDFDPYSTFVDGNGTTYLEAAGDTGTGMQNYRVGQGKDSDGQPNLVAQKMYEPMSQISPLEIMVGGTSLRQNVTEQFTEKAWGEGDDSNKSWYTDAQLGGSGGGYSLVNPRPLYQVQSPYVAANQANFPLQSVGMRLGPDISLMSKPGLNVLDYDSDSNQYEWEVWFGSSLATPMMAGVMAIIGQGRSLADLPALSSSDSLNFIYQAPAADFHDITAGNNGYAALPGFDLSSGRGTVTGGLITDLVAAAYPTTTTLGVSAQIGASGPRETFTASVTAAFGARIPTGSMTFSDNDQILATVPLDAAGRASFAFNPSALGKHAVRAVFTPSSFFQPSADASGSYTVDPVPTTATLTTQPVGSFLITQPLALAVTVTAAYGTQPPVGTVAFYDSGQLLGALPLDPSGHALFIASPSGVGSHSIEAIFAGSDRFLASRTAVATVDVTAAPTTTTLQVVTPGILIGQPALLAASVLVPGGVTNRPGSIRFWDNGSVVGEVPVSANGQAVLSYTPAVVGTHLLLASYVGSDAFTPSASELGTLVALPTPTTTTLTVQSVGKLAATGPMTLTATVLGPLGIPTGMVEFRDGTQILAQAYLDASGRATAVVPLKAKGKHQLVAVYVGTSAFGTSQSVPFLVQIGPARRGGAVAPVRRFTGSARTPLVAHGHAVRSVTQHP